MSRTSAALAACCLVAACSSAPAQTEGAFPPDHRLGAIAFTFDDGTASHYTNAHPILQKYGLHGVFCVNAGRFSERPGEGHLTAQQCLEMYRAGHEIVDHTLMHDSQIWGRTGSREQWEPAIQKSLAIFADLGIEVRGWSLPGGHDSVYHQPLRQLMPQYYQYARGGSTDLGYPPTELCWNFQGDPHGFLGVYGSWESTVDNYSGVVSREDAARAVKKLKASRAHLIQRGALVGVCFHQIEDRNGAQWALEELCKWAVENRVPVLTYREAFAAFRNPRQYYPVDVEQIPCAGFRYDLDQDGRPDGWEHCSFAPADIENPTGSRVVECEDGATAVLCGPEPGPTRVAFEVRSADASERLVRLRISGSLLQPDYSRRRQNLTQTELRIGPQWQELSADIVIPERTDRCSIWLDVPDGARIYAANPTWRRTQGR